MGEVQLEFIISRMTKKYGVDVELKTPTIPYKETITKLLMLKKSIKNSPVVEVNMAMFSLSFLH
ncbi:hypothetical protein [Natranaerobius trueperi]|uniref:hypothetical protein n=1 Tax=Natranaerobius trueperi TaxID=759412 RepID=UPI00197B21BC|nr:hypothetical protein [Natranaerobius trueperi]